jgi:LmbE family N-acetylglucosaminyl deacetylase
MIHRLRDGFFPYVGSELKECFEQIKTEVSPDLILTHYRHDLHQDHRLVSELTWNTFRHHLILEYEFKI